MRSGLYPQGTEHLFNLRRVELLPRGVDLAISWQISTAFYPLCQRLGRALTGARLPGYDRSAMEHGTKVSPKVPPLSQAIPAHNINIYYAMNKLPRRKKTHKLSRILTSMASHKLLHKSISKWIIN